MKIAYVLYPDFTALDLVGPYEVISRWPDADVHFLADSLDPVRCDCGLTVIPTDTPETLPDPDLIVVPGSGNPVPVLGNQVLIDWLRAAAPGCQWTASVCTGAGLYAAAGLLEGKKTTTHWGFRDNLRAMGVEVVADRVVWEGNHISGAGVSAGIDMALALTERGPRTRVDGIAPACHRIRPATSVRLRFADQGRRQHAPPGAARPAGRSPRANGDAAQPAQRRRTP
jgi:transcriptional regulator GlxA family with amidase domain